MRILSEVKGWPKPILLGCTLFIAGAAFFLARSGMSPVETVPLKRGDLSVMVYGSAQLKTDRSFELKLGVPAKVTEVKKSVGNRVRKGQLVITFDNMPDFRSPIDGVITALNFKIGETAFAQSTVVSIVEPKEFYLEMSLDQKSVRYIRPGQSARISFDGYRDLKIDGRVRAVFSNNGLFFGIIDMPQHDPSFLPGMSADVAILTETRKNVLLAPLESLSDGKLSILREGSPVELDVTVGKDDGRYAEIEGPGVRAGDQAVVRAESSRPSPKRTQREE